jgi:hypothetical protein
MYRILPLLGDAGLSILIFVLLNLEGNVAWWSLVLLPFIFLPDLDSLPQLYNKGYTAASVEDPEDHREAFHKPLFWLVSALFLSLAFGYAGELLFFLFLAHFLHDSVLTGWGVPWLAPWSSLRVKFFADEQNRESLRPRDWVRTWTPAELREMIRVHGNENWIKDLYLRPSIPSMIEYSIFAVGIVALLFLFTHS